MLEQLAERIARKATNFHGEQPSYLVTKIAAEILEDLELDLAHLVGFAVMVGEMQSEMNCSVMDPSDHLRMRRTWHEIVDDDRDGPDMLIEAREVLHLFFTPVTTSPPENVLKTPSSP